MASRQQTTRGATAGAIRCSACHRTYCEWEPFFNHVRSSHAETQVSCGWCGAAYTGKELKRHMMSTHAKQKNQNRGRNTTNQHRPPSNHPTRHQPHPSMVSYRNDRHRNPDRHDVAQAVSQQAAKFAEQQQQLLQTSTGTFHPKNSRSGLSNTSNPISSVARVSLPFQSSPRPSASSQLTSGLLRNGLGPSSIHSRPVSTPPIPPNSTPRMMGSQATIPPPPTMDFSNVGGLNALGRGTTALSAISRVPTKQPPLTPDQAAEALMNLKNRAPPPDPLIYIAKCTHCSTQVHVLQSSRQVICCNCNKEFDGGPKSDRIAVTPQEMLAIARRQEAKTKKKLTKTIDSLSPWLCPEPSHMLTEEELGEIRSFEQTLKSCTADQCRDLLKRMYTTKILSGRKVKLESDLASRRAMKRRGDELSNNAMKMTSEQKRILNEGSKRKLENVAHPGHPTMDPRGRFKRPLMNPTEGSPAKKMRLNDNTAMAVSNGYTNGHDDGKATDDDVVMTGMKTPSGSMQSSNDAQRLLLSKVEGDRIMREWTNQAMQLLEDLRTNDRAKPLAAPSIGEVVTLRQVIQQCEGLDDIWEIQKAVDKLWAGAVRLSSMGEMRSDDVAYLRDETHRKFVKILGEPKEWPVGIVRKFFEHLQLPENNQVVENIVKNEVDGAKLFAYRSEITKYQQELGLSCGNAAICFNSVKRCEQTSPAVLVWLA